MALWTAAAASVVYWTLALTAPRAVPLPPPAPSAAAAIDPIAVARLLGGSDALPPVAAQAAPAVSRFALIGVVSGNRSGNAALIAVDGKPAKPYKVGSAIEDGLVLQSASPRQVTLAATSGGPALFTLDMPLLKNN
jgi:general secretion pathway protein C